MKKYKFEYLDKDEKKHSKTIEAKELPEAIDKLHEKEENITIKNIICKGEKIEK